jgi:hypothetical protein
MTMVNENLILLFTSIWYSNILSLLKAGMDPAWSGRGGTGALPALVPSCVGHVCRPPINLLHHCIWIVIVVHSSFIIMLLLKLLYLILPQIIFYFIMKNSTPPPAPPHPCTSPPSKSIPDLRCTRHENFSAIFYASLKSTLKMMKNGLNNWVTIP